MPTIEERARVKNMIASTRSLCGSSLVVDSLARDLANELERTLEAHDATLAEFDAYKREVSDTVEKLLSRFLTYDRIPKYAVRSALTRFILPKPVDPLVEAVKDCGYATLDAIEKEFADDLRAALAKRGLKLVEVGDAD